jgi:hypothetical protein
VGGADQSVQQTFALGNSHRRRKSDERAIEERGDDQPKEGRSRFDNSDYAAVHFPHDMKDKQSVVERMMQ